MTEAKLVPADEGGHVPGAERPLKRAYQPFEFRRTGCEAGWLPE